MTKHCSLRLSLVVLGTLTQLGAAPVQGPSSNSIVRQPPVREIGSSRQLFLDDWLIDRMDNVARWVHRASKERTNPLLKPERPWEGKRILYSNVIYDEKEQHFKLWYNVRPQSENLLCYATSSDGLSFKRPSLGLREFDGSGDNNLVLLPAGAAEARVFRDDHDPQRRYKMVFMKFETYGISVAWSPDGLKWTAHEYPVIVPTGDGLSTPFWDNRRERYVYYHRPNGRHMLRWSKVVDPAAFPTRRIGLAESFNYTLWSDLKEVVVPDERDGSGTDFYYMPVLPYQDCYVGFLIVYHEYTGDSDFMSGFNYTLDAQLTFSRDGQEWSRVGERQTFLGGSPDSWDEKRVYPECALVQGDEIWIYYRGSSVPHKNTNELAGEVVQGRTLLGDRLGLARMRLDGFVSVRAGREEGLLTTWPLRFDGGELWINADASRGSLQVEVLDLFGKPVPGFSREDCRVLREDQVRWRIQWSGGPSLQSLAQPIRLRFILKSADLYSFQIRP